LTIFCGVNSSGKSTIIQSILLISQTLSSKVGSRSVVLNGNLAKLGQFDDLVTTKSGAHEIVIGWECQPLENHDPLNAIQRLNDSNPKAAGPRFWGERIGNLKCNLGFTSGSSGTEHELQQLQPQLSHFSIKTNDPGNPSLKSLLSITRLSRDSHLKGKLEELEIKEPESESLRASLLYNVEIDPDSLEEITDDLPSASLIGCSLRHFIPVRLTVRLDEVRELAYHIFTELIETRAARAKSKISVDIPLNASVLKVLRKRMPPDLVGQMFESEQGNLGNISSEHYTLKDWRNRRKSLSQNQRLALRNSMLDVEVDLFAAIKSENSRRHSVEFQRVPRVLVDCVGYLDTSFAYLLRYLGPLRDEPKSLYPITTSLDPTDVGIRGENTAAVYDLHRKRKIVYIPSVGFRQPQIESKGTQATLSEAVLDWLQYLGVASDINTKDRGKLGHELRVIAADTAVAHDLTHVGVGVSQVLPILVACLLAVEDTILIIEQPELHLHPRVQTLLADFFLTMALLGKQCILETHSEHIINRLRYRIASTTDESLTASTKIYFAEKQDGNSHYRPVPINEFGAIIDWPAGFFDESQKEAEALLRAAMEKRRKRATK
jgi:predicted ATPase